MENLVKLRVKSGLSQANIAKKLSIPLPTYQRYEQSGIPSEKRFIQIAKCFNCSCDYLLGLAEQEKTEIEMLTLDEKMVLNNYNQLTEKEKMAVHEYLNAIILEKKEKEKNQRVRVS